MAKSWAARLAAWLVQELLLLRVLKSIYYISVAELRIMKKLVIDFILLLVVCFLPAVIYLWGCGCLLQDSGVYNEYYGANPFSWAEAQEHTFMFWVFVACNLVLMYPILLKVFSDRKEYFKLGFFIGRSTLPKIISVLLTISLVIAILVTIAYMQIYTGLEYAVSSGSFSNPDDKFLNIIIVLSSLMFWLPIDIIYTIIYFVLRRASEKKKDEILTNN